MKKVLLASTALVGFAGAAAAEVTITGSAEMGIYGGSEIETQFFQDLDVTFSMSGETDGGLSFGASVDLDESDDDGGATGSGAFAPEDDGGATIFVSGGFGTVTMGDTDGAMDWALTEAGNMGNPGSIADDETTHAGYLGAYLDGAYDGQIVRYDYAVGDFGFAVSTEMDDSGDRDAGYALGLKYATMVSGVDMAFGFGYQTVDAGSDDFFGTANDIDLDAVGVSAVATLASGFTGGIEITQISAEVDGGPFDGDDADIMHYGLGFGYETGPLAMHINYGLFEGDDIADFDGIGVAVGYDLGGGASVLAGYSNSNFLDDEDDYDQFSLGLSMSF